MSQQRCSCKKVSNTISCRTSANIVKQLSPAALPQPLSALRAKSGHPGRPYASTIIGINFVGRRQQAVYYKCTRVSYKHNFKDGPTVLSSSLMTHRWGPTDDRGRRSGGGGDRDGRLRIAALANGRSVARVLGSASLRADAVDRRRAIDAWQTA